MKEKASIAIAFIGASMLIVSCNRDYQKLATEFERALPNSMEVLTEQINDVDHFVFFKNRGNTELIRYDLETESKEVIMPDLEENERIYGIYMGKENIAFLKHDVAEYGTTYSTFLTYNLKTQKFKEIESFTGAETIDALADEGNKSITGYMGMRMAPIVKYIYDFDGNKVSEEVIEQIDTFNPENMLEDVSAGRTYQQQRPTEQMFYCNICRKRVMAYDEYEANIKAGDCKRRPVDGNSNIVTYQHQ